MKNFFSVCITAFLLAACSTPAVWDKPGVNEASRKDDLDSCHLKALSSPQTRPGTPASAYGGTTELRVDDARATQERLAFEDCMAGKGYGAKR